MFEKNNFHKMQDFVNELKKKLLMNLVREKLMIEF